MVPAQTSQVMPLAAQSLLLDGQVVGDRIVVVGERGHILISEDHGMSWQQQEVPTRATLTSIFFFSPAKGWAAGHDSVILQTSDGGRHWTKVYSNPDDERPILDLWFKDAKHGYAIGAYGLFLMTHDGGHTWVDVDFNPATLTINSPDGEDPWAEEDELWIDFHLNQISATSHGRVFIAAEAGQVFRSDDGCRSWLSLPSPYEGSFYGSLPVDHDRLFLFGLRGHLFMTRDYGSSWVSVETQTKASLNDGILLSDGRVVIAGHAGTLLVGDQEHRHFQLFPREDRSAIAKIVQAKDGALILIGEMGVKRMDLPASVTEGDQ